MGEQVASAAGHAGAVELFIQLAQKINTRAEKKAEGEFSEEGERQPLFGAPVRRPGHR
ncbi:hypothetical protein ABZ638_14880 [Streptomyces sp. NPDC007107]|uniref:hypothetical protein n=1 Tax=Streptomyces sp. NPDC007107 TaxID=3156915 RepID=UPI0033E97752